MPRSRKRTWPRLRVQRLQQYVATMTTRTMGNDDAYFTVLGGAQAVKCKACSVRLDALPERITAHYASECGASTFSCPLHNCNGSFPIPTAAAREISHAPTTTSPRHGFRPLMLILLLICGPPARTRSVVSTMVAQWWVCQSHCCLLLALADDMLACLSVLGQRSCHCVTCRNIN